MIFFQSTFFKADATLFFASLLVARFIQLRRCFKSSEIFQLCKIDYFFSSRLLKLISKIFQVKMTFPIHLFLALICFFTYQFPLLASWESYLEKCEGKKEFGFIPGINFIYMINLKSRPEKWEESLRQLAPYNIFPYRFEGIAGEMLSSKMINDMGLKFLPGMIGEQWVTYFSNDEKEGCVDDFLTEDSYENIYFDSSVTKGCIGCLLSHLSILKDAYESNYETIWVMEDDIQVVENPLQMSFLISSLDFLVKDWDILYTDTDSKDFYGNLVSCNTIPLRPNLILKPLNFYQRRNVINEDFLEIGMRYGTYSMIIRKSGIKKILDYFKKNHLFLPIDIELFLIPELKQIAMRREIVSTRPGIHSDTR